MNKFTQKYFETEYINFFQLCSSPDFMELPEETKDKTFEALGYIYFNLDDSADINHCAVLLQSASINYTYRDSYHKIGRLGS